MHADGSSPSCTLNPVANPVVFFLNLYEILDSEDVRKTVGTWLSLVERTLGVGEVASSNLVVPTIYLLLIWEFCSRGCLLLSNSVSPR